MTIPVEVTAAMFQAGIQSAEATPLTIRVTRLPSGHKEVVLTQTLCDALGQPVKEIDFGCVAKGELALLDDDELVNIITEALSEGLISGGLRLEQTK